ncbi:30S ribosome-binding factor RbfA [Gemmatimonadota bacterium]
MSRRIPRLNEQLKREVSEILAREVRDPRVGLVIVTGADVTPDLWVAKIYVQLTGDTAEREQTLAGLEAAASFVRIALGKRLQLRRIPEIRFLEDLTLERASRIEQILDEVLPPDAESAEETEEDQAAGEESEEDPGAGEESES